jgi:hypothetical protein
LGECATALERMNLTNFHAHICISTHTSEYTMWVLMKWEIYELLWMWKITKITKITKLKGEKNRRIALNCELLRGERRTKQNPPKSSSSLNVKFHDRHRFSLTFIPCCVFFFFCVLLLSFNNSAATSTSFYSILEE